MNKLEKYDRILQQMPVLLEGETDPIVWMSTLSCLAKEELGVLWAGFYRVKNGRLAIGPYQGSLGCLHIDFGRGVCGACAAGRTTVVVSDVHEFPDHIACDSRARSEIVVPILDRNGQLRAVFDLDSDELASFDEIDREKLELIASGMRDLEWTETR